MLTEEMLEPYEFDAEVTAGGPSIQDPNRTSQMDRTLTQGIHSQAKKRKTQSQRHTIKREVSDDEHLSDCNILYSYESYFNLYCSEKLISTSAFCNFQTSFHKCLRILFVDT